MKRIKLSEEVFLPIDCLIYIIHYLDDFNDQVAVLKAFESFHKDLKERVFRDLYDTLTIEEVWSRLNQKRNLGFLMLISYKHKEKTSTFMFVPRNMEQLIETGVVGNDLQVQKFPHPNFRVDQKSFSEHLLLVPTYVSCKLSVKMFFSGLGCYNRGMSYKECMVSSYEVDLLLKKKDNFKMFMNTCPKRYSEFLFNYLTGIYGIELINIYMEELIRRNLWIEHKITEQDRENERRRNFEKIFGEVVSGKQDKTSFANTDMIINTSRQIVFQQNFQPPVVRIRSNDNVLREIAPDFDSFN